jgi:hypothetical protein
VGKDVFDVASDGAGKVGQKAFEAGKAAQRFDAAAAGAHDLAHDLGGAARLADVGVVTGHLDPQVSVAMHAAHDVVHQDAHELTQLAKESRTDTTLGGALASVGHDLLHPTAAIQDAQKLKQTLAHAEAYGRLPSLDKWLPAGRRQWVAAGAVVHDWVQSADHLRVWVQQQFTGSGNP